MSAVHHIDAEVLTKKGRNGTTWCSRFGCHNNKSKNHRYLPFPNKDWKKIKFHKEFFSFLQIAYAPINVKPPGGEAGKNVGI